jgi:heme-binding NEAT domain protein
MTWLMCRLITILNDASQQITTLLYKKRACELNQSHIISTDEDPGLRIESFAVINLRGVSTNKTKYDICTLVYQVRVCDGML